jgi:hypothetical protein
MLMQWINELVAWWMGLSPEMAFFFSLPFLVAAGGLAAHCVKTLHSTRRGGRPGCHE